MIQILWPTPTVSRLKWDSLRFSTLLKLRTISVVLLIKPNRFSPIFNGRGESLSYYLNFGESLSYYLNNGESLFYYLNKGEWLAFDLNRESHSSCLCEKRRAPQTENRPSLYWFYFFLPIVIWRLPDVAVKTDFRDPSAWFMGWQNSIHTIVFQNHYNGFRNRCSEFTNGISKYHTHDRVSESL